MATQQAPAQYIKALAEQFAAITHPAQQRVRTLEVVTTQQRDELAKMLRHDRPGDGVPRPSQLEDDEGATGTQHALELGEAGLDPTLQNTVAEYNADDCNSTRVLRDWLEAERRQLEQAGHRIIRNAVAELEPALAPVKHKLAGAIYGPTDSSGDSVKFTRGLRAVCERMGTKFALGAGVKNLIAQGDRIHALATEAGEIIGGDIFVLSAGVHSPHIARTVGIRLPIAPAKGYSATFPVNNGGAAVPRIGAVDEELLVAWCGMGDQLRMTSSAEFTGYETTYRDRDFRIIRKLAESLLPQAADYERGTYRACNRPMTPDEPPILGIARHDNLYINSGHGHMGFTMACGSSRIVADLIDGRKTEIPVEGMTLTSRP